MKGKRNWYVTHIWLCVTFWPGVHCRHFVYSYNLSAVPSVLWHLAGRQPVKNWVVRCWHDYLSGARCRLACGPANANTTHSFSCFSKIQVGFTFLVPTHPGSPGKTEKGPLDVCVCVVICDILAWSTLQTFCLLLQSVCIGMGMCCEKKMMTGWRNAWNEVDGPRPRGRPKRTRREVVREDCQARKLDIDDAIDRSKWRKVIKDVHWSGWVWVGECYFWYWPTWVGC